MLHAVLLLFLLTFLGCAVINRFIFTPKKEIVATPAKSSIPYEEIWFQARDGVNLNGWLIAGTPGIPLLLFCHGNAGNLSDNLEYIGLLHGQGFPIFIFDYRGYGKSGGEPVRENDLYEDARGALFYLEGRGWQHEQMIFFGQSLGAAVALQMARELPPAGLVMESSFTRMEDIIRHLSPLGYYTVGWWGIDLHFDNLAKIATVGVPLLLIHGENDEVAPLEMSRRLFARAAEPKMLHIINGGGHCNVFKLDSSNYLAAWNSYIRAISIKSPAGTGASP
ncbi:MAG TPA: alpha/beta hydrolase [Desulfuromonadaceae bacterium]